MGYQSAMDKALSGLFASDGAVSVDYNGAPVPVIVLEDRHGGRMREREIEVLPSDVPAPDIQGDTIVMDADTWQVVRILEGPGAAGVWRLLITNSDRRHL